MNLNEIPAWSDIESQPWFAELTPEEKQQSLTKWQGDMMSFAKDPKEKFAVAATSKAKARSFFGEEMPDDPIADALQRRQKDLEDIGSRYDAFSKGELEEDDEEVLTLNDTLKGNTPYSVIKGRLFVSPQLVWDKAAYEKVVNEAPVDEDERVLAMSAYDGSKERAAEGVVNSLGYTDEAFRDFAAKGFKEGKSNAAILDEWKANNKLPDGILGSLRGVGRQAYFGLRSGLSGLERAMGGLGGFFGSESAQKYAEESGKEAQSYMQRTLGEGPEFIGELTSGAVSIIPTMAAGAAASLFTEGAALPAAASITAGAIQSAGATQAETYEFYRNQGLDHANALAESRVDGLVSGLITGAITHYAGKLGGKIGLGKGIEGLFSGPASKIASKLTQREISESLKAGAKAVGGSFIQEGSEELLDQTAQDAYSMIKRDPTLTLAEAINNALQAGKVGAVLGGAAEAGKIGLKSLLNSAKFSVAETPLEKELQSFFEGKQIAADAVVGNPNVQNYIKALGTAKSVVDENLAVNNRLTADVLNEEVNEDAENLKDNIKTDVTKVAANIAPLVNEAPPVVDEAPPPALSKVDTINKAKADLDERAKALGYDNARQLNLALATQSTLSDEQRQVLEGYGLLGQEIKALSWEDASDLSDGDFSTWAKSRFPAEKPRMEEELRDAADLHRALTKRGDTQKAEQIREKIKNAKRRQDWTFESWNKRFPDEPRTQEEIDTVNAENTAWNADVDAILESFGEAPAEAPTISPKLPVSPASETAPISGTQAPAAASMPMMVTREMNQQLADLGYSRKERNALRPEQAAAIIAAGVRKEKPVSSQPPQGKPVETPTNALPIRPTTPSLPSQERPEMGLQQVGEGNTQPEKVAETRSEEVGQDQQKFLSDLQFYGTARLGDNTFAIKQASDDSFYIEKTTGGQRSTVASGFLDIEAAQRGAAELVAPTPEEVASTGQPPTLVEEALPERGASVETIASGGGMSVEEARQFLARRSDSGEPLIFGRPFSEISGMQQNERPRVLQASDKLRAVKQVVGDINKFRIPVSQDVVNAYGITLPSGYVRQGDLYVFQTPSPPTTGAVPTETLPDGQKVTPGGVASPGVSPETAPEPAPEAQPEQPDAEWAVLSPTQWASTVGKAVFESRLGKKLTKKQAADFVEATRKGETVHKLSVEDAVTRYRNPVSAAAVDAYGITLPEGYVKQGELYVYEKTQPLPKDDAAGERGAVAPAPTVEPAPEAQPEQPVSQPVQAFRDAISQMTPTAQAKWTPELRATAEAYLDSGGTTGLQGLSDVQQKVVGRFLPEDVKAAFDAEDARKRAQRNKLPDHRESSLPPTPGKQIRKIGKGAMESVPAVLDEIAKVIPNIRDLVEVRESVEGEPDAEGFYDPQADKAVVLVDNVYLKPQHGGSQEAALRETIVHELLHRGFAKLRQTNPQLFEQFEAFSLADTNDAQFEALVRRGYSMYSNWKDDPAQNQKAREEIFIRKAVVDLNFKGIEAIKSPSSLASQFFSWLRGLLNKLLGRKVDDETLLHWSRVFLNAAQADFIEKTPGERAFSLGRDLLSPEKYARHAELEAKHNAGTITPEETAEAQALVDEAAKAAGYSERTFHGSKNSGFTVFDLKFVGKGVVSSNSSGGFYFSSSKDQASWFADPVVVERTGEELSEDAVAVYGDSPFYALVGDAISGGPFPTEDAAQSWGEGIVNKWNSANEGEVVFEDDKIMQTYLRLGKPLEVEGMSEFRAAEKTAKKDGYDSIVARDVADGPEVGDVFIVFSPEQIKSADPFTGVPLEQRFQPTSPDIRYSLADKDAEYLDAVEAGDMETAQRMVDEAAKAAGIDAFEIREAASYYRYYADEAAESGNFDELENYGSNANERATKAGLSEDAASQMLFDVSHGISEKEAVEDAIKTTTIKSADPVTYDDAGNVIPLSQRFQTVSPDIRYSLGEPPDMQAEADALREVTPSSQALDKFRETFGTPRQDVGQVLGKKEGSVYTQAQVAPLIEYARSMIGFENDANGDPIISPEATQKALNMVAKINGTPGFASQFNVRAAEVFKGKPVDPEIATAVLTQELQVYANRLSASSPKAEDQILKAALTPFYNTQILGSYLSRRIAGRTLQAASMASGETGDARKSREEAEKAVNKEITKQLGDEALPAAEGMDKAGVEGGVDAIKDDIPAPADPTLRLLDLAVESLDEVAKADANAVFDVLLRLGEAEEALERAKKVGNKAMSILTERRTVQELPSTVEELEVLVGNLRVEAAEKLAKLRSSLEGAKPETKKKVKERATKAGGKAKAAPKVSDKEEDPITKEINALAAELGTLSKLDQAGLDVVKQIAKKLVAKFQPAKLDALKDKVEAVVYKYVQNAERLELAEFSEKMTADLDAIGLKKPELQEALVAKAWAYHFAAPTKAVQALTAKMKSAERADRGGPESVANVRKAINGAVNSAEENRDAFVTRLTDQLVALGVEPQAAEAAAKAAFEYRAKQADKKIERVMETLRLGKRRALLKSFQNTKGADRTEEWQRATLKAAFVEAGLTNKQAEKGADKAMQEAEAIFATAEMKVAEIKQRGVQKFLDSLASVEDETPVTKTKQDNLRSVFKDATLDEEFNEAVLMDRFQTLGATEAQAKALVEKVAEVREDKAEALAEAKRKQVNKVIDATYKRIAQIESGTPSEKAKKQESLRNAVGAAIKAKEFDEAAFRASVASFGASEPQAETLVQNVKKLRQLGESKPLSKAKLRQFLLSFPKNVLANPEQREALLRSFLKGKEYSEAEINRIVPQVLRDFDTGYQKARKAYLDELEKKLKPKQGQKESKQDQQNRKMLNALRSGLADTTSETSVALAKSLGFEAFRPQDDHILSKLDEEMRKLREQGRLSDSNAKFDAIKSLLIRRRPPRGFGEVVAQSWITSALSSLSNLAVNVWAPMGEAGVRLMSDIVRATALRKFDEIPLYFEAAGKAMKGTLSRFNFAVKTDTFTNSVNTLIAGMASMKDEMQRSAAVLKDKNASPAAKANAGLRYVMSFGDYSRRILSSIDDTWYTALSSYVGSSNLIKLLGDAKMPKKAVEAIVFHANNDALNQARAEYETLQAVEQFIEAMRGKTNEEIDAGFEYLGLNDASVTKEQANYIQELVSAFQSLRLRSGAAGDELIKRALKELRNFRASVSVRATELGQMRTKELVREALSDTQTPAQVEEAIKEFDENAKKAASFGMGLHRVEGVPPYDILGNMFGIVDAMGRQAVQKSPLLGRMIVGFFGIPLNLLNRAVWFTPYGLGRYFLAKWQMAKNPEEKFYEYSMASQRERTMRFTEAAVGTSMTMLLYALGVARDSDDKEDEGFYITLGGPSNKTEYDAWYARGFRKFSICYKTKSGSVVSVPYGRGTGEVLKGPLMLLGAFDDMRLNKKLGDREDMSSVIEYLNAAAAGIGKQATFLGAKNTAGAFFSEQFGTSTASNLAYSAANLIPFNGLDRSISALALGPPDRSRTGAIWANIPIVRHLAHQPAINVFGDPWGNKSESALNQLWDRQWNLGLIPLNISAPLTGNQKRLYNFIGERLMGPSDPLRGALELRNGYLTDEEFYRYKQYRGKQMAQTWLTDLDRWRKLDDDSLSKAIAELSTKATKKAKDRFNYK